MIHNLQGEQKKEAADKMRLFLLDDNMKTILIVLAIAIGVLALMMVGLGIKMLLLKEKEFKRPCTNRDPKTGRCAHCTCHGKNG